MRNYSIRKLRSGNWYWLDKKILLDYGRKIGVSGIAVYNTLALFSNSKTQTCFPTHKAIADIIGLSRRTVARKTKLLKEVGLIKVEQKNGRCFYFLLDPGVSLATQGYDKKSISGVPPRNINDNERTIINNDMGKGNNFTSSSVFRGFRPKSREELLALDLAKALNDFKGLPLYISFAKKYPESFLRETLSGVLETPRNKIRKSRAALFNYLVRFSTECKLGNSNPRRYS